jgi:hypothetical protein
VDEPTEEISPFDVGRAVDLFDGSETLRYLKLQSSMRAVGGGHPSRGAGIPPEFPHEVMKPGPQGYMSATRSTASVQVRALNVTEVLQTPRAFTG